MARLIGFIAYEINDPDLLRRLSEYDEAAYSLTINPYTPVDILESFARNKDAHVRKNIACNECISGSILREMANDESHSVRVNVARNPNTPMDALEKLSNDNHYLVRAFVAGSQKISKKILAILARDENRTVRESATRNPNAAK